MDQIYHKSALIQAKVQLASSRDVVNIGIRKDSELMWAKFCTYQHEELTEKNENKWTGWYLSSFFYPQNWLMISKFIQNLFKPLKR